MKAFIYTDIVFLIVLILGLSQAGAQNPGADGYTVVGGAMGPQVCLGKWTPSTDIALPGACEGQLIGIDQLTAISSRMSVDRLDKLLLSLSSIDQKLSVNNDQLFQLVRSNAETQNLISRQVGQINEFLRGAIERRFEQIPEELLDNDLFREELEKLKEDILKEIEKYYSRKPITGVPPKFLGA